VAKFSFAVTAVLPFSKSKINVQSLPLVPAGPNVNSFVAV
jgi:hypothetical protein